MAAFNKVGPRSVRLFHDLIRDPHLVGLWGMNEQSGGTVYDKGPNRMDGTVSGSPDYSRPFKSYENAGQFTAANAESLTIADNASLSVGNIDFTITAWVYFDSLTVLTYVVNHWIAATNNRSWRVLYWAATNRIRFDISSDGINVDGTRAADTLGAPATATWYFVVAWHDSVANTINIQVNNGGVDSTAYTLGAFDSAGAWSIGADAGTSTMDGRIGPVGFWKRVLTSAERTALYRGSRWGYAYAQLPANLKNGLISYWNLTEASGTRNDSHSTNHLTDNNTVTANPGVVLLAPSDFYGLSVNATPYVSLGDQAALSFDFRDPFSVVALVTPYSVTARKAIFAKASTVTTSAQGYALLLNASRQLALVVSNTDTTNELQVRGGTALSNWTAYMVGSSYAGSTVPGGIVLYVNGAAESPTTVVNTLTAPSDNAIAANIGAANGDNSWPGDLGIVAVFNTAKTAEDFRRWASMGGFL